MSFIYKNPISPLTVLGNPTVSRTDVFGTNFSVLTTGGYMEVYSLTDLYYTVPTGFTGLIEYSANTIPIQFNKGLGTVFSPDVLTLNSDNISSGRRRIGMLVYVIDLDEVYQYQIPNFEILWSGATGATGPGGPTVVFSNFGTTIKSNTPEGVAFISSWTANTIEGISGETSSTAVWKKFSTNVSGLYLPISGGTVTGDTNFTSGLTANTISATTYQNLPIDPDTYITGFTYSSNTFTITDNSGNTYSATFNDVTGLTINGNLTVTGDTNLDGITANTISASTYQNLPIDPDTYITAYTYNNNTFSITDNLGNVFTATINDVTGFTINGNLTVTGDTNLDGTITSLSLSGSSDRMVQVNSGGTMTATTEIINAYISSATTVATLLSDVNNWDINGNYIGVTPITGTFQGQRYYDGNYFFEAVLDNVFIRLIRG